MTLSDDMSLRPRPGETAADTVDRVVAAARKRAAIESLVLEANAGLVDDETFARRMTEIGATDEEIMEGSRPTAAPWSQLLREEQPEDFEVFFRDKTKEATT